ncbi:MAG TPA: Sir2 family NAD-dependent protein deacetylase [Verrucomicrobiae bacterium]|jgi:NAD-dependent deacetylase|nr:Sir2 family NAD-dependent protein deacetylase [Verrucomicrobiae bacterium]
MTLDDFAARLRNSRELVFFTGAGISTESGVPDFRSPGGIWTKYQPVYFDEFVTSEAARVRYWTMKRETHELYRNVRPNVGHYSIAAFEKRGRMLGLITQNVDGLHAIAGVSAEKMVELHGTDRKVSCLGCGREFDPEPIYARLEEAVMPPSCDACGGLLKPATISFGQAMPQAEMRRAQEWSGAAEIFIVVGSSLVVQPAASFPVVAKQNGALLAIVNREPTPLDDLADYHYRGAIGEFFTALNPLVADG